MKLGCSVWTFTRPSYNAPYEQAIETIASLGFEGVELIVFSEQDLKEYYTSNRVESLVSLMRDKGLTLSEVAVFDSVVAGLSSLDKTKKKHALENFKRCADLAARLGSGIINMVSQWPEGLEGPTTYPPHAIYLLMKGQQYFRPKNTLKLPVDFSWDAVWENYVDSIRQACRIAAQHDLRFALEGHTHVIVQGADSMLRLIDWVGEDNLGVNLDTGWHFTQREYIPLSILKLGSRIFHVHTRDGDGILSYGLPPGSGILDWEEIIKALRSVGYGGFLSFEMTRYEDPEKYAKIGLDYLQKLLVDRTVAS